MKKKVLCLILGVLMSISLASCGGNSDTDGGNNQSSAGSDTNLSSDTDYQTSSNTQPEYSYEETAPPKEITVEDVLSAPATPASDFKYSYHEETEGIMIEYYTGTDEIVVIPDTIDGEPVTFVTGYAFSGSEGDGNSDVRAVKMPDSVYAIGRCAFEYNDTIEIVICGTGMKRILENNFYYCKKLKYIYVPSELELIGDRGEGVFWDLDEECVVKSIAGSLIDEKIKELNEVFPDEYINFETID